MSAMKFLLRSLLVLAVAVLSGLALYYAVQNLPSISRSSGPTGIRLEPSNGGNATENPAPRPGGPERNGSGIRWRSLLGVARRTIIFTFMVFIAIIGERFIFHKKTSSENKNN